MKVAIRLLSLARSIDCFVAKELLVSCLRATGYRMMQAPRFQLQKRKLCCTKPGRAAVSRPVRPPGQARCSRGPVAFLWCCRNLIGNPWVGQMQDRGDIESAEILQI